MTSPYALELDGFDAELAVLSLEGKEALSKSYRFRVVVRVAAGAPDLERVGLGLQAELVFKVDPSMVRAFNGIIAKVRLVARRELDACDYELELVPRLWLLKKKRRTRVLQNLRIVDVVAAVLGEAGIASRWQLQHTYPLREYCTQYEETDYQFVDPAACRGGHLLLLSSRAADRPERARRSGYGCSLQAGAASGRARGRDGATCVR